MSYVGGTLGEATGSAVALNNSYQAWRTAFIQAANQIVRKKDTGWLSMVDALGPQLEPSTRDNVVGSFDRRMAKILTGDTAGGRVDTIESDMRKILNMLAIQPPESALAAYLADLRAFLNVAARAVGKTAAELVSEAAKGANISMPLVLGGLAALVVLYLIRR